MESLFPTNNYYRFVEERYQLSNAEQVHSLMHVAIGVALKYIIENIKTDAPGLKVNRVIKDELSHVAGISISSIDKYLGKMFQSNRPIDPSTLDKLSSQLFYCNKTANSDFFASGQTKYLLQKHIGVLGELGDERHQSGRLINDLITFIRTKPPLIKFIQDNVVNAKYSELIERIFLQNRQGVTDTATLKPENLEFELFEAVDSIPLTSQALKSRTALIVAFCVLVLGALLPSFILTTGAIDSVVILDYLIHDPGKHFFHIVIFPCMVWAFLRCFSIQHLLYQKTSFFILIAAGFLLSFSQTYVQHSQSICDLVVNDDYVCNDIVERLFDQAILDTLFLLYSSFLSLIPSLFSIIVFACQLLELRNRGHEICSAAIYSLINLSFIVWAVARSYSEWHEVALSFEIKAISDFTIFRYQSFLITATMLVISQIIILIQVAKSKSILRYFGLFIIVDAVSFWLATNIHKIAPNFHSITHSEPSQSNILPVIVGPLIYCYFIAIIIVFIYVTIVNKVRLRQYLAKPYSEK